jgi:hypothetical protein
MLHHLMKSFEESSHEHNRNDFTPQQTHSPIIHHKWCLCASGSSSHIMDVYRSRRPLKCCAWQLENYQTFTFEMQMSIQEHIQLYVSMPCLFSCHWNFEEAPLILDNIYNMYSKFSTFEPSKVWVTRMWSTW